MSIININQHGKAVFDPYYLVELLSREAQLDLVESLACQSAVVKHVVDQILTGWTEHDRKAYDDELQDARQRLLQKTDKVAAEAMEQLQRQVERLEKSNDEWRNKYY